jgi:hypothetical protein
MDIMQTPKLDPAKLTPEQRDKLEAYNQAKTTLETLKDIADINQEMLSVLDNQASQDEIDKLGVLLVDVRETLQAINNKEAPEQPDTAKPVVEAISKLERALAKAVSSQKAPVVNIPDQPAPVVNVDAPAVDLSNVEKVLKTDLPKAFNQAIQNIVIPQTDNSALVKALEELNEQLVSIDTAVRMQPQAPTTVAVTNPDGTNVGGGTVWGLNDIEDTGTYKYFGFSAADGSWKLTRKTLATNVWRYSTGASGYTTAWTDRATQTYNTYDATF